MKKSDMKVLALDIENSYIIGGMWGLWNQNFSLEQLFDYGKVLCYAARWVGDKHMAFERHDNEDFLTGIHRLLDEADAVLTFNGKRHDLPLLNREFLKAGLSPPSPYKHIDLLETAKRAFKFPSNKLQHLVTELGIGSKLDHEGFELWTKALANDEKAWATMEKYNKHDVVLLEKLYKRMLPWIAGHPNHNLYTSHRNGPVCNNCGGRHLQRRGFDTTLTQKYQRYKCMSKTCGKWMRSRFTVVEPEIREYILTGAAN